MSLLNPANYTYWTTEDELAYVRHLYEKGNAAGLKRYIWLAINRKWHGPGMNVDPGTVLLQAQDWLTELKQVVTAERRGQKNTIG